MAENLRLLCRAHNRLVAERIYGKAYISQAIGSARAARGALRDIKARNTGEAGDMKARDTGEVGDSKWGNAR
jgi:hypothetical protein